MSFVSISSFSSSGNNLESVYVIQSFLGRRKTTRRSWFIDINKSLLEIESVTISNSVDLRASFPRNSNALPFIRKGIKVVPFLSIRKSLIECSDKKKILKSRCLYGTARGSISPRVLQTVRDGFFSRLIVWKDSQLTCRAKNHHTGQERGGKISSWNPICGYLFRYRKPLDPVSFSS